LIEVAASFLRRKPLEVFLDSILNLIFSSTFFFDHCVKNLVSVFAALSDAFVKKKSLIDLIFEEKFHSQFLHD
jgi:hypothetical protein